MLNVQGDQHDCFGVNTIPNIYIVNLIQSPHIHSKQDKVGVYSILC